ncbi:moesin isoform X1, partial [Paramuricea clavata]
MPKLIETIVSTKIKDLRVPISQNTTGRELFYKIVAHIGLKEIWYFGLEYTDSRDAKNWLKLNRKVFHHDIKWSGTVIRLKFRVKFYPEDLNDELIQLVTQRLFFLQAKEEILQDDVYCPTDKAVLLASLGCQAEFGEYNQLPISGRFLNKEKLLPDRIINQYKLSKGDWDRRITELWRRHGEMH